MTTPTACRMTAISRMSSRSRALIGLPSGFSNVCQPALGPGAGLVVGEVFDDSVGQPLAGATVAIVSIDGEALDPAESITTDPRGRFLFERANGAAIIEISAAGFSGAVRELTFQPGRVVVARDARLGRVVDSQLVQPSVGASFDVPGELAVEIEAGTIAEETTVGLAILSPQAMPTPMPIGWSIHAGASLGSSHDFFGPSRFDSRGRFPRRRSRHASIVTPAAGAASKPRFLRIMSTSQRTRREPSHSSSPMPLRLRRCCPNSALSWSGCKLMRSLMPRRWRRWTRCRASCSTHPA